VTSLQARCSVIAAANPVFGRYDPSRNFKDNVELTDPILSRFDILSVIWDEVNEGVDKALACFVINNHIKTHPEAKENAEFLDQTLLDDISLKDQPTDLIPQDLLKKYILYAWKFIHPRLNDGERERITEFYSDIRKYSA